MSQISGHRRNSNHRSRPAVSRVGGSVAAVAVAAVAVAVAAVAVGEKSEIQIFKNILF